MRSRRLAHLRRKLAETGLAAMLVVQPENRFYLSGFTGSAATLLITQEAACLFTDFRYTEQAAAETTGFEIIQINGSTVEAVAAQCQILQLQELGFEDDYLTYRQCGEYKEHLNFLKMVPAILNNYQFFRRICQDFTTIFRNYNHIFNPHAAPSR